MSEEAQYKKLTLEDKEEAKRRKREVFIYFSKNPFSTHDYLSNKFNVSGRTIQRWKDSREWGEWLNELEGYSKQSMKAKIVTLTEDAFQYASDLLNGRVPKEELKASGSCIKLLSLFMETSGLVNQKPNVQINQQINNNGNTQITTTDIKQLSPSELKDFLIADEIPDRILESKKENEAYDLLDYEEVKR